MTRSIFGFSSSTASRSEFDNQRRYLSIRLVINQSIKFIKRVIGYMNFTVTVLHKHVLVDTIFRFNLRSFSVQDYKEKYYSLL